MFTDNIFISLASGFLIQTGIGLDDDDDDGDDSSRLQPQDGAKLQIKTRLVQRL